MKATETNHKAWMGALGGFLGVAVPFFVARATGITEGAPPWEDVAAALEALLFSLITAGVGYAAVWFGPKNQPKP